MASIYVTLKIMPESPDSDLSAIEKSASSAIEGFGGKVAKAEQVPVAFGLKSINLMFLMDEEKGDTEKLESEISGMNDVQSVQVIDVRRAVG